MRCCVLLVLCASVALGKLHKHSSVLSKELASLEEDIKSIQTHLEEQPSEFDDPFNVYVRPAAGNREEMSQFRKVLMYLSLFFSEKIRGTIPASAGVPGTVVMSGRSAAKQRLLRMMWWGSQYGYNEENHYKASRTEEPEVIPIEKGHIHTRLRARGDLADARAVIYIPGDFTIPGDSIPVNTWYCQQAFGSSSEDYCEDAAKVHVTFRGMQLSLGMTTPPVDDLVNMRGLKQIADCPVEATVQGEKYEINLRITQGTCKLLLSLLSPSGKQPGLLDDLIDEVEYQRRSGKNVVVFMQGLSFGGALAQAAGVLFSQIVQQTHLKDTVRCAIATFGAPRVGGIDFSTTADSLIRSGILSADQYIMYTYYTNPGMFRRATNALRLTTPSMKLHYDPIAMWPTNLYPIGKQYTLLYHKSGENLVTDVRQDLKVVGRGDFNLAAAKGGGLPDERWVPNSSMKTFYCLHLFPLYKNFLEHKESLNNWCDSKGSMRLVDDLVVDPDSLSREEHDEVMNDIESVEDANFRPPTIDSVGEVYVEESDKR